MSDRISPYRGSAHELVIVLPMAGQIEPLPSGGCRDYYAHICRVDSTLTMQDHAALVNSFLNEEVAPCDRRNRVMWVDELRTENAATERQQFYTVGLDDALSMDILDRIENVTLTTYLGLRTVKVSVRSATVNLHHSAAPGGHIDAIGEDPGRVRTESVPPGDPERRPADWHRAGTAGDGAYSMHPSWNAIVETFQGWDGTEGIAHSNSFVSTPALSSGEPSGAT